MIDRWRKHPIPFDQFITIFMVGAFVGAAMMFGWQLR